MKKRLILCFCVIVMGITGIKAQQTVAVLTHEGTSKTFSGYNALQEAYQEAANGDLITLSSGTFGSVAKIEKALKIRGMGMEADTIYNTSPTIISGDMMLAITDGGDNNFRMEGIYHANTISYIYSQKNPEFIKCRLNSVTRGTYLKSGDSYYGAIVGALFYHCKVASDLECAENSSITAINSYISGPLCWNDTTSVFDLHNCVIKYHTRGDAYLYSSTASNCVFATTSTDEFYYNSNTTFKKCLLPLSVTPDKSKSTYSNWKTLSAVFKTFDGTYTNAEDFELVDEFNSTYGMYSGPFPYSPRLSGPHIEKMEVAPRSTDTGTLNVRIKVKNTVE